MSEVQNIVTSQIVSHFPLCSRISQMLLRCVKWLLQWHACAEGVQQGNAVGANSSSSAAGGTHLPVLLDGHARRSLCCRHLARYSLEALVRAHEHCKRPSRANEQLHDLFVCEPHASRATCACSCVRLPTALALSTRRFVPDNAKM
jgi:hypothetical protein